MSATALRRGDTGADVLAWQRQCERISWNCGGADALFGSSTEACTIALQRRYGLVPDGVVGPLTHALADRLEAALPAGRRIVARVSTPLSLRELTRALASGHQLAFNAPPAPSRALVALCQVALETGRGKLINNLNLGNITAGPIYPGAYFVMRVPPPDPPRLAFRSYTAPELSAADYWRTLAAHYRPALAFFDTGDAFNAGVELKALHYFTDDRRNASGELVYAAAMRALAGEFRARSVG